MDNGYLPASRTFDVPVEGGTLRGVQWGASGPVVLCAHGITANYTEFQPLADQLAGECRIIAVDHRGRGNSRDITGPWGMAAHAADMRAVLDHLKLPRADVFLGHSMGGFIGAVTAAQYPDRVGKLMMVDGGIPLMSARFIRFLPFQEYFTEKLVKKLIGPSLARLDMTFASREAYQQFWRAHPALATDWSPYVEHYIDYDLVGTAPQLRSSVRKDALMRDSLTQLVEDVVPLSLKAIKCPVVFMRAEHGIMNATPLYDPKRLRRAARGVKDFTIVDVNGVNHFTIMLSERGAKAVAAEVRQMLGPSPQPSPR